MENYVCLPFEEKTYLISYQNSAFPLGIIQANAQQDISPWIASKYINCCYHPGNIFDIGITDKWSCVDGKLFYQRINLIKNLYDTFSCDYVNLLRGMLNLGYYANGIYNEEYIFGKASYKKNYFVHDYLLIGYDDKEQVFYSVGYLADGNFQRFIIPYDSMKQALESLKEQIIPFYFLKYNSSTKYVFDTDLFLQELFDYIYSKTSIKQFRTDVYFGIRAIREMANDFIIDVHNKQPIDTRYTRTLMEHKFLMVKRIDYLSTGLKLNLFDIQKEAIKVYRLSKTIHLLGIKYLMTRELSTGKYIIKLINEILELEDKYLPMLYDCVKTVQRRKSLG